MRRFARNAATAAIVAAAAAMLGAADTPRDGPGAPDAATPSIQSGGSLAACRAWTDGCVICRRSGDLVACSNPGIACQPGLPRCLETAPAAPRPPQP